MPILNVREMGSMGVVTDIAPWDLPPSALSYGVNFRLSNGKVQMAGGIAPASPPCGDELGHITQMKDYAQASTWVVCGANGIKTFDGSDFFDVSQVFRAENPKFSGLDPTLWSSCKIGQVLFLNHPDLYPIYWADDPSDAINMQRLPWHVTEEDWEAAQKSCKVLCSHKNFLFALGMKEESDLYADKVWWSHPAEPDGIPFSWRPTSEQRDSIAGWVNLGRGGAIVGGESLRDSFIVYSEEALNAFDFTGDALGWRRRTISTTAGLVNKEAVTSVDGRHFFIASDDIMSFDGNSVISLMHNRIRKSFAALIDPQTIRNAWSAHYATFNEIWFAVPEKGSDYPNIAYVFNYRDGTWGIRDLEKQFKHGHFGDDPVVAISSWDSVTTTWDTEARNWPDRNKRVFERAMYSLTADEIYNIDPYVTGYGDNFATQRGSEWNGVQGSWDSDAREWISVDGRYKYSKRPTVLSRTDLPIGGHEQNTTITRVYPHFEGADKSPFVWNAIPSSWDSESRDWNYRLPGVNSVSPWQESSLRWSENARSWDEEAYDFIELRFGSQQHAGGDVRWAGDWRRFTPGLDRKIDIRTTGELHAFQIRSKGGFFNLTGMDIEFKAAGGR